MDELTNREKETILLTCGDQMLAQHFRLLYSEQYHIRMLRSEPKFPGEYAWVPERKYIDPSALEGVDHILHLPRLSFTPEMKSLKTMSDLYSHHTQAITLIGRMLMDAGQEVKSFVVASSVDYYGEEPSALIYNEYSRVGRDFLAREYQAMEEEAQILQVEASVQRTVIFRFGRVLYHFGGVLPKMTLGSQYGIAPYFGSGHQLIPWVHINDAVHALEWAVANPYVKGIFNCTSPVWHSFKDISVSAAYLRSGKVRLLPLPDSFLRVFQEGVAESFISGMRVSSGKIIEAGFEYSYPRLEEALLNIYDL